MPISAEKIAQMELALASAKAEFEREKGKLYDIIMREMSEEEKQRILDSLTDKRERILFGLEAPERTGRPGKSGGDLVCPICGKKGLTPKGLGLHTVRMHKDDQGRGGDPENGDMLATEGAGVSRRRSAKAQGTGETADSE